MTACNQRPPAGHPLANWGVACHLAAGHQEYDEPHSWDIDAITTRHATITRALDTLRHRFPDRTIERLDVQLPHPIVAYDVDEHGNRSRPYRAWDLPNGPWVVLRYTDGEEFAIWKATGDIYRVGPDGAVGDDPIGAGAAP